jgi:hypothetical protein
VALLVKPLTVPYDGPPYGEKRKAPLKRTPTPPPFAERSMAADEVEESEAVP